MFLSLSYQLVSFFLNFLSFTSFYPSLLLFSFLISFFFLLLFFILSNYFLRTLFNSNAIFCSLKLSENISEFLVQIPFKFAASLGRIFLLPKKTPPVFSCSVLYLNKSYADCVTYSNFYYILSNFFWRRLKTFLCCIFQIRIRSGRKKVDS